MALTRFSGFATALNQIIATTGVTHGPTADTSQPIWATVYQHGSVTLATVYDRALQTRANPFLVNIDGSYEFYGADSSYDVIFSTSVPVGRLIPDVQVQTYPAASFPAASASLAGRLARAEETGALWISDGTSWSPVNAITQTVLDPYDIRAYGAIGDDATDNTTAIQAALNAVHTAGGGTVFIPHGIFRCGALTYYANTTVRGDGWQSVLKAKNALNDGWIGGASGYTDDCAFLNLAFDGNKANNSAGNILYLRGRRLRIEDCYFHDSKFNAVYMDGDLTNTPLSGDILIANNLFHNVGALGYGPIGIVHGSHIDIRSNRFTCDDGGMAYAIDFEPNSSAQAIADIAIDGNSIQNGRIYLDCTNTGTAGQRISVTNNVIDARDSGTDLALFDNAAPLYLRNLDSLQISGNIIYGVTGSHRQMIEVGEPISSFQITGNIAFCSRHASVATYAIDFPFSANVAVDGLIANNYFIGYSTIDLAISSFHPTAFSNVVVRDNHFTNVTAPYVVNALDTEIFGIKVVSVSADYTMPAVDSDHVMVLADATSGSITITPPTPTSNRGRRITVVKTDSSSHIVTIDPDTTWNGGNTILLVSQYDARTAVSDHFKWVETARHTKPLVLDVKADFGAMGDGATDDTATIQAAINAATPGATVFFPPGTYICNRAFVKAGVTLRGTGAGSVLKLGAGQDAMVLDIADTTAYCDDVQILDLTIDGNKNNNASRGGISLLGRRCTVSGCVIKNAWLGISFGGFNSGVADTPAAGNSRFSDNVIAECRAGILIIHGSDIAIADNVIENLDGDMTYGIGVIPNPANLIGGVTITGNHITGGTMELDASNVSGGGYNLTVVGNHVNVTGFLGSVGDKTVPIYLRNYTGVHISGNMLIGHAPSGYYGGMHIAGSITRFLITGNTLRPTKVSGTASYGMIFANTSGVATDGVISNNLIATESGTLDNGIYSVHATGWSNVESFGNRFHHVTTDHTIGASGMAIGPASEWTANVTWNPGAISDGVSTSTTKTFTGVAIGDWVHASMSGLVANMYLSASVTSTDTVTLSLLNKTGSGITVGSSAVRIVARKYNNAGVY